MNTILALYLAFKFKLEFFQKHNYLIINVMFVKKFILMFSEVQR